VLGAISIYTCIDGELNSPEGYSQPTRSSFH